MKRILVTGGAGYLGSILCRKLLDKGHAVRCFDRLYFGMEPVKPLLKDKKFQLVQGDIINLEKMPSLLDDVDAVIHLAGIANDPTAELDPHLTHLVNYKSSVRLADMAKRRGVGRFIFASSCSVYGKALADVVDEDSPINPVSVYAESKALAEMEILKLKDKGFHPVSLRQATLYGLSPRMRFDLAINLMVLHSLTKGKIFIWGGGDQWRPFLHVDDAAEAMMHCLSAPIKKISGKIYNLGSTRDNYKIINLAMAVKDAVKGTTLDVIPENSDKRSYCVNCDRVHKELRWKPRRGIREGIEELSRFFEGKTASQLEKDLYYNIRTVQKFIQTPAVENGDPVRPDFLPFNLPLLGKEEEDEVIDTLRSGWLTTGPKTKKLEGMFQDYLGCRNAICVNSCTAALHLSLVALDIKKGDEVITSPITWPATANVIVHTGATPVFADVDPETFNINPEEIERKITSRTKAVIPVHMAGQPCDMAAIRRIAKKHKLFVIEDAAHAIGAVYDGKKIGAISDFTCFSFYPIKNMTTIEGGLVTTPHSDLAEKVRMYSLHGVTKDAWKRYDKSFKGHAEVIYPGFKYNMSDVQAAVGLHQLPRLDEFIRQRGWIARQYEDAFRGMEEVSLVKQKGPIRHAHHLFIIMIDTNKLKLARDEFIEALKGENIGSAINFRSLHIQPYYKKRFKFKDSDLPNAYHISDKVISLPLYPKMSQYDIDTVVKAVKKLIAYYKR